MTHPWFATSTKNRPFTAIGYHALLGTCLNRGLPPSPSVNVMYVDSLLSSLATMESRAHKSLTYKQFSKHLLAILKAFLRAFQDLLHSPLPAPISL